MAEFLDLPDLDETARLAQNPEVRRIIIETLDLFADVDADPERSTDPTAANETPSPASPSSAGDGRAVD